MRVLRVEPLSEQADTLWRVTLDVGNGQQEVADYKGVVIANGTLSEPSMPQFEGQFSGQLLHTSAYKSAELFKGKRVLIVGAGNSGCDIAVDAVHYAKSVDISVRRGYYFVPKYVFGKPADTLGGKLKPPPWLKQKMDSTILQWFTGDPVRFGFPKPDYKMYESHPVVNSLILHHLGHGDIHVKADVQRLDGETVHFKDGTQADYDLILAATGITPSSTTHCSTGRVWRRACTSTFLRRVTTGSPCWAGWRPVVLAGRAATNRPSWWRASSRRWTMVLQQPRR